MQKKQQAEKKKDFFLVLDNDSESLCFVKCVGLHGSSRSTVLFVLCNLFCAIGVYMTLSCLGVVGGWGSSVCVCGMCDIRRG